MKRLLFEYNCCIKLMLKLEQLFLLYIFLTYLSQECCCCCNVYRYLLNCYSFHYLISIVIDHQSNNSQSLFHFIICQLKWHNNSTIFDLNAILTYLEGEGCLHGRHTSPWCLVVVVRPNPALRCRWPGNLKVKIQ